MVRVNGRAIEDYKRFEVRETGLAVPEAEPLYVPAISNGYAPHDFIVDSSLVLYLPLYLLKGSKFKSVDRYGHTCTVTEALWQPDGRYFDGTNDDISVPDHTSLQMTDGLTVEMWVRSTDGYSVAGEEYVIFIDKQATPANTGWRFYWYYLDPGAVRFATINTTQAAWQIAYYETDMAAGTWYHIVATLYVPDPSGGEPRYRKVYVDTVKGTDQDSTDALEASTATLHIGNSRGVGQWHKGDIGEVRIYNRALSATEIAHNYKATAWRYQ